MDKKKVSIIGGGIAGLTAGVYAQLAGYKSTIYEKNSIVGGECTGWDRKGFHIDNCIHWMTGTKPDSDLNEIWKKTGALDNDIEVINQDRLYTSKLNGESLTFWKDKDKTINELLKLSPEDKEEIMNLINDCTLLMDLEIPADKPFELKSFFELIKMPKSIINVLKIFKKYDRMDTQDVMNKFKHPLIKCAISDFCTVESKGYSFIATYGSFLGGDGGIPKGGSRAMALRMVERYKSLGGEIKCGVSVSKMNVGNEKVVSMYLENGEEVVSDYYISTCDMSHMFDKILDKKYMPKEMSYMFNNPKEYPVYGMFQVAFAIDDEKDYLKCDINLDFNHDFDYDWIRKRVTFKSYSYEPSFAPNGKQIVQAILPIDTSSYEFWLELNKDKKEYNTLKEKIATKLKERLLQEYPMYEGKIEILDTWTPVTYHRYCNAYRGYNQSFMPTKYSKKNMQISPYPIGISNVVLAGQWINIPGGLSSAAISGKFAVQRMLKKDKMHKKINL